MLLGGTKLKKADMKNNNHSNTSSIISEIAERNTHIYCASLNTLSELTAKFSDALFLLQYNLELTFASDLEQVGFVS